MLVAIMVPCHSSFLQGDVRIGQRCYQAGAVCWACHATSVQLLSGQSQRRWCDSFCRVVAHLVAGLRDQDVAEVTRVAAAAHHRVFLKRTPA